MVNNFAHIFAAIIETQKINTMKNTREIPVNANVKLAVLTVIFTGLILAAIEIIKTGANFVL